MPKKKDDETINLKSLNVEKTPLNLGGDDNVKILTDPKDLDKKKYIKITPTFYIQTVELEEGEKEPEEGEELYKILNPETDVTEKRQLTDEEKHQIFIKELKEQKIKFRNTIHDGNITRTKFGVAYKKERAKRNRQTKKTKQMNRRKK